MARADEAQPTLTIMLGPCRSKQYEMRLPTKAGQLPAAADGTSSPMRYPYLLPVLPTYTPVRVPARRRRE